MYLGEEEIALECLQRSWRIENNSEDIAQAIVDCLSELDENDKAISFAKRFLKRFPQSPLVLGELAHCKYRIDTDEDEVVATMREALAISKEPDDSLLELLDERLQEKLMDPYRDKGPNFEGVFELLGGVAEKAANAKSWTELGDHLVQGPGEYEVALECARRARALDKEDEFTASVLVDSLFFSTYPEFALAFARKYLKRYPDSVPVMCALAVATLYYEEDEESARVLLEKCRQLDPQNPFIERTEQYLWVELVYRPSLAQDNQEAL